MDTFVTEGKEDDARFQTVQAITLFDTLPGYSCGIAVAGGNGFIGPGGNRGDDVHSSLIVRRIFIGVNSRHGMVGKMQLCRAPETEAAEVEVEGLATKSGFEFILQERIGR